MNGFLSFSIINPPQKCWFFFPCNSPGNQDERVYQYAVSFPGPSIRRNGIAWSWPLYAQLRRRFPSGSWTWSSLPRHWSSGRRISLPTLLQLYIFFHPFFLEVTDHCPPKHHLLSLEHIPENVSLYLAKMFLTHFLLPILHSLSNNPHFSSTV